MYKGHERCTPEVLKGMQEACKGYESCAQRALKGVEGASNENVRSSEGYAGAMDCQIAQIYNAHWSFWAHGT